jgi:NADH-quinone oxidoreductase subunit A
MEPQGSAAGLQLWEPGAATLVLYGGMCLALIAALVFLCGWLGEKKPSLEKARPYECGVVPTGVARFRYPIPFYLVAIFFLVFDVEAVYILTWAVAFDELGWWGWLRIAFFIAVLLFSLVYLWRKGELDWGIKPS